MFRGTTRDRASLLVCSDTGSPRDDAIGFSSLKGRSNRWQVGPAAQVRTYQQRFKDMESLDRGDIAVGTGRGREPRTTLAPHDGLI